MVKVNNFGFWTLATAEERFGRQNSIKHSLSEEDMASKPPRRERRKSQSRESPPLAQTWLSESFVRELLSGSR